MHTSVVLELDEAIVFVALKHNLSFNEYKLMAEWLDCYNYVLPVSRGLHDSFVTWWKDSDVFDSPTDIYKLWMKSNLIYTTLMPHQQRKLLSWMHQPS